LPRLIDIAPTVLQFYGITPATGLDGKALLKK
jgi:arylsulfatase A-like enzyme